MTAQSTDFSKQKINQQHIQDFFDILAELSEVKGLRVAVTESAKGGLIAGATTAAGALLLGPIGFLIGAVVGGTAAFINGNNKFKPVATVLKEMTPEQKKRLYDKIRIAITNINPYEVVVFTALLLKTPNVQEIALKELGNFLSSEMNLKFA